MLQPELIERPVLPRVSVPALRLEPDPIKIRRERRRHDCAHLNACEEAWSKARSSAQGRCPATCAYYEQVREQAIIPLDRLIRMLGRAPS